MQGPDAHAKPEDGVLGVEAVHVYVDEDVMSDDAVEMIAFSFHYSGRGIEADFEIDPDEVDITIDSNDADLQVDPDWDPASIWAAFARAIERGEDCTVCPWGTRTGAYIDHTDGCVTFRVGPQEYGPSIRLAVRVPAEKCIGAFRTCARLLKKQ